MKTKLSVLLLSLTLLVCGCGAFLTGGEVQSGRQAFLIGDNEAAAGYFRSAAERNPDYVYGSALRQGIWSYVGRSEYATGRLPAARESLERALSRNQQEDLARLYLGLTLARSGDQQTGVKEIETGMRGIYDWLEYVTTAHRYTFGQFWDPRREIRSAIQTDLAMLDAKDVNMTKLISDGEWLGRRVEQESDDASRDEQRERELDSGGKGDQP